MLSSEIYIAAAADRFSTRVPEQDGRTGRLALSYAVWACRKFFPVYGLVRRMSDFAPG
jgi:hypothetical protein